MLNFGFLQDECKEPPAKKLKADTNGEAVSNNDAITTTTTENDNQPESSTLSDSGTFNSMHISMEILMESSTQKEGK